MAKVSGSSTAEVEAPIETVWQVVEDVESAPQWQGGLKSMDALERDGEGHAVLCEVRNEAKVTTVRAVTRFTFDPPHRLSWIQEEGDLKSVEGYWELEELDAERTRASYHIEAELGRKLSMLIRGPMVDVLRQMLAGARAGELKKRVESS